MGAVKIGGIVLVSYVLIVVAFESLIGFFQPEAPDTLVLTTLDEDGAAIDRVLQSLHSDGQLYVAANHWPRAWHRRALANPRVQVTRGGETRNYMAVREAADVLLTRLIHPPRTADDRPPQPGANPHRSTSPTWPCSRAADRR